MGYRYPFVLCYHLVAARAPFSDPHGVFLPQALFARHLDAIAGRYKLLTVGALWERIRHNPGVFGFGAITFDDAFASTARDAIPLLQERGMPCSVFVPTGWIGRPRPDVDGERILSATEIRELADAGVEIGAHTVDHVRLPDLSFGQALDQLTRSRATLEDLLGKPVRTMAYPYGALSAETELAAAQAGYEVACGCGGPAPWRALNLPREPVFASTNALRLRLKIAGLYGPGHRLVRTGGLVDRLRAAGRRGLDRPPLA